MASYHSSFTYNGENSAKDRNLIITTFEPDNGLKETFLSMDIVSDSYHDGTKRYTYSSRYNATAVITITVIKNDGSDFSLAEVRSNLRWLTGIRVDSWMDMYIGDSFQYAFLGRITNVQQQKMDARTIGLVITFSSVSPWAYSAPQTFNCDISQLLDIYEDGILDKINDESEGLGFDNGVVTANSLDDNSYFKINNNGVIYLDNAYRTIIDNQTDDLYTNIYLDIDYVNENSTFFSTKNLTLNEESLIKDIKINEKISVNAKQFIISDIPNKIFGDSFNFVWPRLAPGANSFVIEGDGRGSAKFTYRYPMKVGDCAMDVDIHGGDINCGNCPDDDNNNGGVEFNGTISWDNITDTPTTIAGYGITDAYTKDEVDYEIENIEVSGGVVGSTKIDEEELNKILSDILG